MLSKLFTEQGTRRCLLLYEKTKAHKFLSNPDTSLSYTVGFYPAGFFSYSK